MFGKKTKVTAVTRDNREPYALVVGQNRWSYSATVMVMDPTNTVSTRYFRWNYWPHAEDNSRVVAKRTFLSRKRANNWAEHKVKLVRDIQAHANYENRITI